MESGSQPSRWRSSSWRRSAPLSPERQRREEERSRAEGSCEHQRLREREVLGHPDGRGANGVREGDRRSTSRSNVKVSYTSKGNNIPTVLATAIAGGNPPDIADVAQPGLVKQFVQQKHLKPITYANSVISKNFAPAWPSSESSRQALRASLQGVQQVELWNNVHAFKTAGVKAPKTWNSSPVPRRPSRRRARRPTRLRVERLDLTDLFENIYLRAFGPRSTTRFRPTRSSGPILGDEGAQVHEADRQRLERLRRRLRRAADRLSDVRRLRLSRRRRRPRWCSRPIS